MASIELSADSQRGYQQPAGAHLDLEYVTRLRKFLCLAQKPGFSADTSDNRCDPGEMVQRKRRRTLHEIVELQIAEVVVWKALQRGMVQHHGAKRSSGGGEKCRVTFLVQRQPDASARL